MQGIKGDAGKPPLNLIVPGWIWEVGLVIGHGATKYAPNDWQHVKPISRWSAAISRHLLQAESGESLDSETGLSHMAHIATSAMFLYWFDHGSGISYRNCICPACSPS